MSLVITSTANPKVKDIVQLLTKSKERKSRGVCVVEGAREINRALACGWEPVELWQLDGSDVPLNTMAFPCYYLVAPKVFNKIAYRNTTESAVAVFRIPAIGLDHKHSVLEEARCLLILEFPACFGHVHGLFPKAVKLWDVVIPHVQVVVSVVNPVVQHDRFPEVQGAFAGFNGGDQIADRLLLGLAVAALCSRRLCASGGKQPDGIASQWPFTRFP